MEQDRTSIDYETLQKQRNAARGVLRAAHVMHEETYLDTDGQIVRDPPEAAVLRLAVAGQLEQPYLDQLRDAGFEV